MRWIKAAAVLVGLLVVIVGAMSLFGNRSMTLRRAAVQRTGSQSIRPTFEAPKRSVVLFFLARDESAFHEETREIGAGATTTDDARRTLGELVKGPQSEGLAPTIPREAQLLNLFIDTSGTAYVDFDRRVREGQEGGAQGELYAVFSIVDTLTSNFAQITRVQILVEGAEIPTLAGHVDTRMPLPPQFIF